MSLLKIKRNYNYLICENRINQFDKHYNIGDYIFQYQDNEAVSGHREDKNIIIFGKIVNSRDCNSNTEEILEELLESNNFKQLIDKTKKMAGRYVVVYHSAEGFFVLSDAAASVHIAYTIAGNDLYVSSNPKIIADINGWEESLISKKIKSSAEQTHPLPYDMTMYDEIKFVIPNHYLDCKQGSVYRYYPLTADKKLSVEEAAEISSEIINNIIKSYYKRYKLSLPLTSGIDSRTILSVCKNIVNEIPIYTFFHGGFTEETPDIYIPKAISRRYGLDYIVMNDLEVPDELLQVYRTELGSSINSLETMNAWTYYNSRICKYVRLDGNVSPLAKSNFGRNLPEFLATSSYLVTKTHNYSRENKREIKRWIKNVNPYSKRSAISKFDLFFWEHRVGKWTSNSLLNSDLLIDSLNIFNCRELIEIWLRVPRKDRMNGEIHKKIIELNWPELLIFPINPGGRYSIFYKNSLLYYIGSKVKYLLGKGKY